MEFRAFCARMFVVMQVLELMKTHATTTRPEATLGEAIDLMDLYQVPSLPVVDAARCLCGMLTAEDVLRAMMSQANLAPDTNQPQETQEYQAAQEYSEPQANEPGTDVPHTNKLLAERALGAKHAAQYIVRDYMTSAVISVSEHADVGQAARLLLSRQLTRLPVTDELGRVVGTVSRVDVIQAVFEALL